MNILIIGLGSIARKHIAAIRELGINATFSALRFTPGAQQEAGVKNIYSLEELEHQPDMVIVSNPTMLHHDTLLELLPLGYPLFIEKPLAGTIQQAEAIQRRLEQYPCFTYVACNLRFHPALTFVKTYLANRQGQVQEVNCYCGSYLPGWRPGTDFRTGYSARKELGGGVHLDLIHELDYCCWLFGKPMEQYSLKRNVSALHIDVADFAAFHLLYPHFTANITLNYYRRDPKRVLEIVMQDATIEADLLKNTVRNLTTGEVLFEQPFEMKQTYIHQMKYVLDCLTRQQQPMNDLNEAATVLQIALYE